MEIHLTFIILLVILFAAWNGATIQWKFEAIPYKEERHNRWFHRIGFVIRTVLFVPIVLFYPISAMLLYIFAAWPLYNAIINLSRKMPILYIGSTAAIDKYIPHWLQYLFFFLLIPAIIIAKILGL
jgi:hypothetical protein